MEKSWIYPRNILYEKSLGVNKILYRKNLGIITHLSKGCKAHAVQATVVSIVDKKLSCPRVWTRSGIADCPLSCDNHDHKMGS